MTECTHELQEQYAKGKWAQRDMAEDTQAKLMFDETVTDHLDIESIVFLGEEIARRLTGATSH